MQYLPLLVSLILSIYLFDSVRKSKLQLHTICSLSLLLLLFLLDSFAASSSTSISLMLPSNAFQGLLLVGNFHVSIY